MSRSRRILRAFAVWFCSTILIYLGAVALFPVDEQNILLLPNAYYIFMAVVPILLGVLSMKSRSLKKLSAISHTSPAAKEMYSPQEEMPPTPSPAKASVHWGDPNAPLPSPAFVVPKSKRKQQELAQELIANITTQVTLANCANDFEDFIERYDALLEDLRKLCLLDTKKVRFRNEPPSFAYNRLQREFQWHMRDAMEREADLIIRQAKNEYRNDHSRVEMICEMFQKDISAYESRFDEETAEFSKQILHKVFSQCQVQSLSSFTDSPIAAVNMGFDHMDGHDFEHFCADILRRNGFVNVEVTPGSGDQGVDILAQKDDILYAIQCKCYSSDLGNKPVQEVNTGKSVYHCQVGAVMTNRYFTQGAKDAAAATGVLLWDRGKLLSMIETASHIN